MRSPTGECPSSAGSWAAWLHSRSRWAPAIALGAQLSWLALYLAIAKPLNERITAAVRAGTGSAEARVWQARWETILVPRSLLMTVALCALLLAIVRAR